MRSTSIQVALTDHCELNRCLRSNLRRTIDKSTRILAITNPDRNCCGIERDWLDALIPYLTEEHDCIICRESMHFLDGGDYDAVMADTRTLALFISRVQLRAGLLKQGAFLSQLYHRAQLSS